MQLFVENEFSKRDLRQSVLYDFDGNVYCYEGPSRNPSSPFATQIGTKTGNKFKILPEYASMVRSYLVKYYEEKRDREELKQRGMIRLPPPQPKAIKYRKKIKLGLNKEYADTRSEYYDEAWKVSPEAQRITIPNRNLLSWHAASFIKVATVFLDEKQYFTFRTTKGDRLEKLSKLASPRFFLYTEGDLNNVAKYAYTNIVPDDEYASKKVFRYKTDFEFVRTTDKYAIDILFKDLVLINTKYANKFTNFPYDLYSSIMGLVDVDYKNKRRYRSDIKFTRSTQERTLEDIRDFIKGKSPFFHLTYTIQDYKKALKAYTKKLQSKFKNI